MLTVGLSLFSGDAQLARKLLLWIERLSNVKAYELLLVCDAGTPFDVATELMVIGNRVFKDTHVTSTHESILNWPRGCNANWFAAMKWGAHRKQDILFLETDAIPLKPAWLDDLRDAWECAPEGTNYLGNIEACAQLHLPPKVISGVGIYSHRVGEYALTETGRPWNVDYADLLIHHGVHSPLIKDFFGQRDLPPVFVKERNEHSPANALTLDWIPKEAVIFHRDKTHSLIPLLASGLGIDLMEGREGDGEKAFFQMGRFGDLILLFPAFKEWADRSGRPVVLFTAKEFASVAEGASYIHAMPLPVHWYNEAGHALNMARKMKPTVKRIQLHGGGLKPAVPDTLSSYSISMWTRTGLSELDYHRLPLVFDKRSPEREAALIRKWRKTDKPLLLISMQGWTSPCQAAWRIIPRLTIKFGQRMEFLNTNEVMADRIYDLLGLMDIAAGMLTIDTATLHLAAASKCPYIAIVRRDGQSGSIPKGNVALTVGYDEVEARVMEIVDVMEGWLK